MIIIVWKEILWMILKKKADLVWINEEDAGNQKRTEEVRPRRNWKDDLNEGWYCLQRLELP